MLRLTVTRLLSTIPLLITCSVAIFLLVRLIPGDPGAAILGAAANPQAAAALDRRLGLDQPLVQQYGSYLAGLLHGNLGTSLTYQQPVSQLIRQGLPITLSLALGGMLLAVFTGIPAGVVAALRRGGWIDKTVTAVASIGFAMPGFWVGLLLLELFAGQLRLFPVVGYTPITQSPVLWAKGLILPSIAIAFSAAAILARQTRGALIDQLESPYVQSLRALGLRRHTYVTRYALKNAMIAILTVIAFQLVNIIGVEFVVEQIFSMPGLGSLLITAISEKDMPIVQGVTLITVVAVIAIFLAVDLAYGWLDPRVRPE